MLVYVSLDTQGLGVNQVRKTLQMFVWEIILAEETI